MKLGLLLRYAGEAGGPGMDLVLEAMLLGGASIDALRVVAEAVL
jgi:hypothetical protein